MPFNFNQDAYIRLRNIVSERTSPIVAWVGAGLSAPAGIPIWRNLREKLIDELRRKIESISTADHAEGTGKLNAIVNQKNPWIAFQMLQRELGASTYRDIIREAMRPADSASAPESYKSIWKLRVRGLINLNIDRLATQAFVQLRNIQPLEFTGVQGVRLGHLLKEPRPFILNMHGHADDHASWVFTKYELDALRATDGYRPFIQSCLYSYTMLFLGLSADDLAVGGHLEGLARSEIQSGTHFWVTSRTDRATDRWAEAVGIRVIRYDAPKDDHSALDEMFKDLIGYVPPEDPPLPMPVVSTVPDASMRPLPPVSELAKLSANEIRSILNQHMLSILEKGETTIDEYAAFRKNYDEAIYRSWYVSTKNGPDKLLGYELKELVAKGAFGAVYRASNSTNEDLAIKILLEEIRNSEDLLHSFRRGVRSMRILGSQGVDGVVAYRDSSEVPAFVVMDWIEGPSLQEAVEAKQLQEWGSILRVSKHLTKIIRQAHELPERVLHRDLRPSNVMLKGFYTDPDNWKLVVLDFDLSWHRGATEKSVVHGSTLFGYLAPEQISNLPGISTRHSAVDSFGIGMMLFFMLSGRHPLPAEHKHGQWIKTVGNMGRECDEWRSVKIRFARLILASTQDLQAKRWDIAQIENELSRLLSAVIDPRKVLAPDLIAEELATRTDMMKDYVWSEDDTAAIGEFPTGLRVVIRGCSVRQEISLELEWRDTGVQMHRKVGKWLKPAAQSCDSILRSQGWDCRHETSLQSLRVRGTVSSQIVVGELEKWASGVNRAIEALHTK